MTFETTSKPAANSQSVNVVIQSPDPVMAALPEADSSTTTISDTNMNTVSEGEWILRSEGQISPGCNSSLPLYGLLAA